MMWAGLLVAGQHNPSSSLPVAGELEGDFKQAMGNQMTSTETLKAKGLTASITREWEIDELRVFFPHIDHNLRNAVRCEVAVTEIELQDEPVLNWKFFDREDMQMFPMESYYVVQWINQHLAPAIGSNYLSVVTTNWLARNGNGGLTTDEAQRNGAPF